MTPADRARMTAALVAVGLAVSAPVATAQSAEAEALFREGRRLLKDGELAAGCAKLEASDALEPSVGTLLNLGDCRERQGKLASAWAAFEKAEALARRTGADEQRQAEARRRAALLEPRLSTLTLRVTAPVEGLVIRRDALRIEQGAWDTPVPVDAGTYTIVAEAPGHRPWRSEIQVLQEMRRVVVVPALAPVERVATAPVSSAGTTAPVRSSPRLAVISTPASPGTWTGTRVVAAGVGLLGAGAVGTGIYFGVRARDLADASDARCPLITCADDEALRLNERARDAATRANVLYAAGGAALAASLVLWLVGAPEPRTVVTPVTSDRAAGISVAGRF